MCEGPDRKPADLECCAGALSGCRTAGRQRFRCTLPGLTCTGLGEREEGGGGGGGGGSRQPGVSSRTWGGAVTWGCGPSGGFPVGAWG